MLLNRLDKQGVRDLGGLAELPSVTARRFWYDTVCYGSKAAFTCACEAFGVEKLVTGSDYPVLQDYEEYRETFAFIERMGLPAEDADRILHHNAQALFGLLALRGTALLGGGFRPSCDIQGQPTLSGLGDEATVGPRSVGLAASRPCTNPLRGIGAAGK